MTSALIGHTGFVGRNLRRQAEFDDFFNSANIPDMAGRAYDFVVCAGAPSEKWKANRDPDADERALVRLREPLFKARIDRFVLISTVDVYPHASGVDERTEIDPAGNSAYGRNRLFLERCFSERFDCLTVRLPALFGVGLKKNVVYDLLHDNMVESIDAESRFQFYSLDHLWSDISRFMRADLRLVNVTSTPVKVSEMASQCFGIPFDNRTSEPAASYDVRSIHAGKFGKRNGYLYEKGQILEELRQFVAAERT